MDAEASLFTGLVLHCRFRPGFMCCDRSLPVSAPTDRDWNPGPTHTDLAPTTKARSSHPANIGPRQILVHDWNNLMDGSSTLLPLLTISGVF